MSVEREMEVEERITAYLVGGGLFNPELANHDAVRDLLRDTQTRLAALRAERDALAKRVADLEDTIDCGCNALTDSIMASGNHPRTNLHWVAKMRRALGPADP